MNKSSLLVSFILYSFLIVISASPLKASASTDVFDDITANTTWDISGSPYLVDLPVFIDLSVTLTIDPGVVVKFGSAGSLTVNGTLKALGTSADKIYFTSILDDSIAGDTNGDGETTLPKSSDWQGVSFFNSLASNISNTEIRFAGYGIQNFNSNLSIIDSVFKNIDSGLLSFGGENNLKNLSIFNIGDNGISLFDSAKVIVDSLSISGIDDFGEAITLFENSSLNVDNSSFSGITNNSGILVFEGSDLSIDHSIISGFSSAIADYGSGNFGGDSISIKNSQIKNNNVGVSLYADDTNFKATGNAIQNNALYGAQTFATFSANFKNNFWGDPSGPYNEDSNTGGLGDKVFYIPDYNKILFSPWLVTWPSDPAPCCSSVIFVPGFEGSRLYEKKGNGYLTQRWEAGIASLNDVKSLFMDNNGNSMKGNIITKDIIETTNYPIFNLNIYKKISDWFKSNKLNQNIKDFLQYSYDWRFDVGDIVQNGTQTDIGISKLEDEIISLSQNSFTGKVTLIGHSNGGLIIKKVIESLKNSGQVDLIDKVILVASPQLGTPQAVSSLLHGDDTSMGLGLILDSTTARLWSQNMPGVYGLIPTEKLYEKIGPFINFESPLSNNWLNIYGQSIDYSEQQSFLTGGDGRIQPKDNDLDTPTILRQSIINKSKNLHDSIDNMQFPANIDVYEIAGVGKYTVEGINYKSSLFGLGHLEHKPIISCDGDKTVISESAIDIGQNKYYLDLFDYYKDTGDEFNHVNITENPEIISLLSNITTDSNENTPHIKSTKPIMSKCRFKVFGMFSPADIDLYDNNGRHVGVNQDQSTNAFKKFDTDIPGSDFFIMGDKKFAIVPDEGEYTLKIDGTGNGLYTLDITTQENGEIINNTSFSDLPVTPALKGSILIDTQSQDEPVLEVDINGDGIKDEDIVPNNGTSPISYLEVIRATIIELELSKKLEKSLLQQIDRVITLVKKNKIDKAIDKLQKFFTRINIGHKVVKEMTQQERDDLVDKINNFLNSI
jgi:nitrous oxidase accessory protein NosD